MRILLFTGKGGVGKSTMAAGTAAVAARAGRRTLVLSTDAAHSLADAYAVTLGDEPTEIETNLWVHQVNAQRRLEASWNDIRRYLLSVLDSVGVDSVAAEELTVIPGAEEILALLELRLHAQSGHWDVIVVDCAPTAETLRLLALPEALGWYLERVLPTERRVVKAFKPLLSRAAGVPMPSDTVFDAIERLHEELNEVRTLLSSADASVRLVMTPESVVLAEARRSWTSLSLFGYRVDGVIANRVFPGEAADAWRAGWVAAQRAVLKEAEASFAPLPLWKASYGTGEPRGVTALAELVQEVYADQDPFALGAGVAPFGVATFDNGALLKLALPGVTREDVDLTRHGDDLIVTVGSYRRVLALPKHLAHFHVTGARVAAGELQVRVEA